MAGYRTKSESEGGNGRYDALLKSTRKGLPNMLFEFTKYASDASDEVVATHSEEALRRIREKECCRGLKGNAILYGISFTGRISHIAMDCVML